MNENKYFAAKALFEKREELRKKKDELECHIASVSDKLLNGEDPTNYIIEAITAYNETYKGKLKDFYISSTKDIIEKIESEIADLTKEFYGL